MFVTSSASHFTGYVGALLLSSCRGSNAGAYFADRLNSVLTHWASVSISLSGAISVNHAGMQWAEEKATRGKHDGAFIKMVTVTDNACFNISLPFIFFWKSNVRSQWQKERVGWETCTQNRAWLPPCVCFPKVYSEYVILLSCLLSHFSLLGKCILSVEIKNDTEAFHSGELAGEYSLPSSLGLGIRREAWGEGRARWNDRQNPETTALSSSSRPPRMKMCLHPISHLGILNNPCSQLKAHCLICCQQFISFQTQLKYF